MVGPDDPAARFWRFALDHYMPRDARTLFLRLQDGAGVDVPLALFCLWCGAEGVRLPEATMREAVAFCDAWRRERVAPLRALRRAWKGAAGSLPADLSEAARQAVASAEQAVERLQMDQLAAMADGLPREGGAAGPNLRLYLRLAGLATDGADVDAALALAGRVAFQGGKG